MSFLSFPGSSLARRIALLAFAGAVLVRGGMAVAAPDEDPDPPMGIDTHIHLFDPAQSVWNRPNAPKKFQRFYRVEDFEKATAGRPIGSTVVVEAGTDPAHTLWMLEHARDSPQIVAVIGNVDLRRPEAAEELRELSRHPKFRGTRIRGYGPVPMDDPVVRANLKTMETLGLVLEIQVNGKTLAGLGPVAERFPRLHIVLNHLAGGVLGPDGEPPDWWLETVEGLGAYPNVFCKISALDSGFGSHRDPAAWAVVCDPLFRVFGPDRLLYGSNWPVSPKDGKYAEVFELFEEVMRTRPAEMRHKILVVNPRRAYRLGDAAQ